MPDTIPPTVPDTVIPTDSLLGNVDFTALNAEKPAAEAPPAEAEAAEETTTEEVTDDADAGAAEETTEEGAGETGAGETSDGEPADDFASSAAASDDGAKKPTASVTPAPEDTAARQAEEQRQARTTRLAAINAEIKALKAIPAVDRDPFEHTAKLGDLLAEKDELRDAEVTELRQTTAAAARTAEIEANWQKFEREYPDVGAKGRRIWEEELAAATKKYPNSAEAATAVANEKWQERVKLVRAKARDAKGKPAPEPAAAPAKPKPAAKAPAAPAGKPAPTKGGGTLIPKGAVARPVIQATDPVQQLVASAGGGGFKGFLD